MMKQSRRAPEPGADADLVKVEAHQAVATPAARERDQPRQHVAQSRRRRDRQRPPSPVLVLDRQRERLPRSVLHGSSVRGCLERSRLARAQGRQRLQPFPLLPKSRLPLPQFVDGVCCCVPLPANCLLYAEHPTKTTKNMTVKKKK